MNQEKNQSRNAHQQLTAARMVLAATGKSPRKLGEESRLKVIEWIYRWGYTTSTVIQSLLARTTGGYAKKLVRQGWLSATKTASGTPTVFYTLTAQGVQEAERNAKELYRYPELDPYKVNQSQIRHYLIAQMATMNGLNAGLITEYKTERMFDQEGDKAGLKRPDVVWHSQAGLIIAAEIELSAKWARDLDEFILGITRALESNGSVPATYNRFAIISDSLAIIDRYRAAMQPDTDLHIWKKNQRHHWVIDKTIKLPIWLIKKIDFQFIGEK